MPSSRARRSRTDRPVQAVVLAAGEGSRLRSVAPVKPLALLAGRPLIAHVVDGLRQAGVDEVIVVLGYECDRVEAALAGLAAGIPVRTVRNPDWRAPNGVSVLAAEPLVRGPALLTMSDHLAEPRLYRRVASSGGTDVTALGIDRRLGHPWVDDEDVTKVATHGEAIAAIGKGLAVFDAYDTGVFRIEAGLFDALRALPRPSLSDGMRALAEKRRATTVDVSDCAWLDVDDARAFAIAETWFASAAEPWRGAA